MSLRLQDAIDNAGLASVTLGPGCPPIHSILFQMISSFAEKLTSRKFTLLATFFKVSVQCQVRPQVGPNLQFFSAKLLKFRLRLSSLSLISGQTLCTWVTPLLINHRDKSKAYEFIYQEFKSRLTMLKASTVNHCYETCFNSISFCFHTHLLHVYYPVLQEFFSKDYNNHTNILVAWNSEGGLQETYPLQIMGCNLQTKERRSFGNQKVGASQQRYDYQLCTTPCT